MTGIVDVQRWRRSALPRVVMVVAMAVVMSGLCTNSSADPEPARVSPRSQSQAEERLESAASRVTKLVADDHLTDFGGLVIAADSSDLSIFWHGGIPVELAQLIDTLRSGGLVVELRPAAHTVAELNAFRAQITREPGFKRAGIAFIAVAPDGSGLQIGFRGPDHIAASAAVSAAGRRIAVTYTPSNPIPASRWNDSAPFYGGAAIVSGLTGVGCSSGFGAHFTTAPTHYFMLTAAHCLDFAGTNLGNENWFAQPGVLSVGRSWNVNTGDDAGSIDTTFDPVSGYGSPGGSGASQVYTGGEDSTGLGSGETVSNVIGYGGSVNGALVTTSGAYSGERDNIRVVNNNVEYNLAMSAVTYTVFGVQAEQLQHTDGAGNGDSGGPVFAWVTSANNAVSARGIISAIDQSTEVPCAGEPSNPPSRVCAWRIFYTDIGAIQRDLNVSLNQS